MMQLTRIVDVRSIEKIETVPNKSKIDTTLKITERMRAVSSVPTDMANTPDPVLSSSQDRHQLGGDSSIIDVTRRDSMDSVCSDAHWIDKCRVTTLRASDPEVRRVFRTIELSLTLFSI